MNTEQLGGLKQFIQATSSQTEVRLRDEIGQLRDDMNEGFLAVGDALEEIHHQLDEQDKHRIDLDKRVTKLERQIAYQ